MRLRRIPDGEIVGLVGKTTEHGGQQRFAIDVLMPIGTPVTAARSGQVVRVEQQFADTDHTPLHENHVWIAHEDGSVGRYFHLTRNGARVAVGDPVTQGQTIGLSGNSGASTAPHLHFDVTRCSPLPSPGDPAGCGDTVPVTFANTRSHSCGLQVGEVYRAE